MLTARPQAVGYSLTDSPAGLAAFLLCTRFREMELRRRSHEDPDKDQVLNDFTLYWLPTPRPRRAPVLGECRTEPHSIGPWKTTDISLLWRSQFFPRTSIAPGTWAGRAYKN